MELRTDPSLRGTVWAKTIEGLSPIFKRRPHYMLYMLAIAIGILYDQKIDKPEENGEEPKSVPRNVIINQDGGQLDYMFQAAILTTQTVDLDENERLDLAFGERQDFNKIELLTQFANFGATKLLPLIGTTHIETMENLKNFLSSCVEGRNLDINTIPDDILLEADSSEV